VGPRAGLDDMEKGKFLTLPGLELLSFGPPAYSQLLSRLYKYCGETKNVSVHISNQAIVINEEISFLVV
jgi:hypothetical protein